MSKNLLKIVDAINTRFGGDLYNKSLTGWINADTFEVVFCNGSYEHIDALMYRNEYRHYGDEISSMEDKESDAEHEHSQAGLQWHEYISRYEDDIDDARRKLVEYAWNDGWCRFYINNTFFELEGYNENLRKLRKAAEEISEIYGVALTTTDSDNFQKSTYDFEY